MESEIALTLLRSIGDSTQRQLLEKASHRGDSPRDGEEQLSQGGPAHSVESKVRRDGRHDRVAHVQPGRGPKAPSVDSEQQQHLVDEAHARGDAQTQVSSGSLPKQRLGEYQHLLLGHIRNAYQG